MLQDKAKSFHAKELDVQTTLSSRQLRQLLLGRSQRAPVEECAACAAVDVVAAAVFFDQRVAAGARLEPAAAQHRCNPCILRARTMR